MHGFHIAKHLIDFQHAGLEEFQNIPGDIFLFRPCENGAQGILAAKGIPVLLERAKVQLQLSTSAAHSPAAWDSACGLG